MTEHERVRALLLTGTVGSGKTAVATEMGLLLEERELPSAIVDLDWLGWVHLGTAFEGVERLIREPGSDLAEPPLCRGAPARPGPRHPSPGRCGRSATGLAGRRRDRG
jgi:hypothetical protein